MTVGDRVWLLTDPHRGLGTVTATREVHGLVRVKWDEGGEEPHTEDELRVERTA